MNPQNPKEKRVLYVLLGTLIILFILLISLLTRKKSLEQQGLIPSPPSNETISNQPPVKVALPQPVFSDYTLGTDLPTLPASVKLSDIKTSYTTGEALNFATKIGFPQAIVEEGVDLVFVTDQPDNPQALLTINRKTGNLMFSAESGYPAGGGTDPTSAAQAFLNRMGLMDDTLIAYATYERASTPGVTYIEFHRDWTKLGLPYLNPVGALNLSETEKLSDVKLGYVEVNAPPDPDIVSASDNNVGKIRPNNFNTVTVAVNEDNTISWVSSNLKLFSQTQTKTSAANLKTPEEALEEFKSGKASFSLTKPMGDGAVDVQTVYPDNQALAENAVITDFLLSYIDDITQKTQTTLYPHYIIKGTATLDSGYQVAFVQTLSAVKQINTLGVFAQNTEPSVFPGQGSTLQYGTFNWLTPPPAEAAACAGLTQIFALPNGGYIGWYPNVEPRTWYYVPAPGETVDQAKFMEIKKIIRWEAAKACRESKIDPSVCAFANAGVDIQTACLYLGTGSPNMYFYQETVKKMQVKLSKATTYVDPAYTSDKTWSFTAYPGQNISLDNGVTRSKLYYEYNKKVFDPVQSSLKNSPAGFLVEKNKLAEFVALVADKVGLNATEQADLLVEMTREANKLSGKTLKVGLFTRETLDKLLPVSINPHPRSFTRLLFYLTSASGKEKLTEPALQKVDRNGDNVVVEVGAVGF